MTKSFRYIIYMVIALYGTLGYAKAPRGASQHMEVAARKLAEADKFYVQRLYTQSMKSFLSALHIAENRGDAELIARIYNGIGNLYSTQGDYQMGLYFYRKALANSRKTKAKTLQNAVLNNLVGASCFIGQADSGIVYLQRMETNVEHNSGYRYNILMGRGLVAKTKGDHRLAVGYYLQARQYAIRSGMDSSYVDNTNSCLAQLYMDAHRPDSAIVLLRKNEEWARRTHHDEFLAETMHLLAQAYDALGDASRATACRMEYAELMERLHYGDELNTMKNTQYLYDANKNASTISLLTQQQLFDSRQIRTQARWLIMLGIGLVVILVLFIVVSVQKRQLRHAYNRLYDRSQLFLYTSMQTGELPLEAASEDQSVGKEASRSLILSNEQRNQLLVEIERVMESVEEFCQTDFSIYRLAQLVDSNPRYVSEAINEGYGKNFRTFLNEYRIKEAMHRLADYEHYGNYTIKAISESVGYKSQANFISIFTRLAGMKPSIYQKISRQRISIGK